jgi:hypothetical protein
MHYMVESFAGSVLQNLQQQAGTLLATDQSTAEDFDVRPVELGHWSRDWSWLFRGYAIHRVRIHLLLHVIVTDSIIVLLIFELAGVTAYLMVCILVDLLELDIIQDTALPYSIYGI